MTSAAMSEIPEAMRPPKTWPMILFTLFALVMALAALYLAWGASGQSKDTDRRTQATSARVDVSTQFRCDTARIRITTPPETAVERRTRNLALSTFTQDCPRVKR